jgi:hypothetical protein
MRIIVTLVHKQEEDRGCPYIYLYEDGCGVEPHEPFEEFYSLREALRHNRNAEVMRYPGKDDLW